MPAPKGPILFDVENDTSPVSPAEAPPITHPNATPAVQTALRVAARRPSWWARLFWGGAVAFITLVVSVAAWDFVLDLLTRSQVMGWAGAGLLAGLLGLALAAALREIAALARLSKLDSLRLAAAQADDLPSARRVSARISALYAGRSDMRWHRDRLKTDEADVFDAEAQLALTERVLLAPLDAAALKEVEAAARHVAMITAFVPLALVDVATALWANLRMIRRIAQIYGGRGGMLGSWRLTRAVASHLIATGAVAIGDDLIGSVAGGGILSKISRRFGEGVINGALSARVGIAAIEVCRPLPFAYTQKPSISHLIKRSLSGLFSS